MVLGLGVEEAVDDGVGAAGDFRVAHVVPLGERLKRFQRRIRDGGGQKALDFAKAVVFAQAARQIEFCKMRRKRETSI